MKIFLTIICCLVFFGCATVHVETYDKATGKLNCSADYHSFFKSLEGVKMSACHASGQATISTGDTEAIKAAIAAMINMLIMVPK